MTLRDQLQAALGSAYTLERELGGGGMSRVFIATENRLHRSVVVKVLSPELAAGVSAERFEREIQLVAQRQQANIVPLLSTGETNGLPYYTMPFVEGESLRARLAKTGVLPIAAGVGILRDVARALSFAHAHGVVHRDIKPDNVLLSHGAAVVTDFGIGVPIEVPVWVMLGPSDCVRAADTALATAHFWRSVWLNAVGRFDEALREGERARLLEPASLIINAVGGLSLYSARRYAQAETASQRVLAIEPGFQITLLWSAMILVEMGKIDSATAILERIVDVEGLRRSEKLGVLAYAPARAGRAAAARAVLARSTGGGSRQFPATASIAAALDALGDRTRALEVFTRAVEQHDEFVMLTSIAAPFDGLRSDPRGAPLFARVRAQ